MSRSTQSIVQDYLNYTRFTLREFGEQLGVSHVTVMYWRDGKFSPDTDLMFSFSRSGDWRGAFAREILASKGIRVNGGSSPT